MAKKAIDVYKDVEDELAEEERRVLDRKELFLDGRFKSYLEETDRLMEDGGLVFNESLRFGKSKAYGTDWICEQLKACFDAGEIPQDAIKELGGLILNRV